MPELAQHDLVIPAQRGLAARQVHDPVATTSPSYVRVGVLDLGDGDARPAVFQCERCVSLTADPDGHTAVGGCGR